MKNILIIVDMQNDFIDGSLANPAAQAIVGPMCDFIRDNKFDEVYMTYDTHGRDYLKTPEGKKLPVEHCIFDTWGWKYNDAIIDTVEQYQPAPFGIHKPTFGFAYWKDVFDPAYHQDEWNITMIGTCTDICVISNALALKAVLPEANIKVIGRLCAGLTPEKHEAALEVMRSCQIDVE